MGCDVNKKHDPHILKTPNYQVLAVPFISRSNGTKNQKGGCENGKVWRRCLGSRHKFQEIRKQPMILMQKKVWEPVEGKLVKNKFEPTRLKNHGLIILFEAKTYVCKSSILLYLKLMTLCAQNHVVHKPAQLVPDSEDNFPKYLIQA